MERHNGSSKEGWSQECSKEVWSPQGRREEGWSSQGRGEERWGSQERGEERWSSQECGEEVHCEEVHREKVNREEERPEDGPQVAVGRFDAQQSANKEAGP